MSGFPRVAEHCPLPSPLNGSPSPFATVLAHGQNVVDRQQGSGGRGRGATAMLHWIRVLPDIREGQIWNPGLQVWSLTRATFWTPQAQTHTQSHTITHILKNKNQSQSEKRIDSFCCFEYFSKNAATMV